MFINFTADFIIASVFALAVVMWPELLTAIQEKYIEKTINV